MRDLIFYTVTGLIVLTLSGCQSEQNPQTTPSLKEVFKNDFIVGAAINEQQLYGNEPGAMKLVKKQFNAISPENVLKWERINPQPDSFNYEPADRYVEFGQNNDMFILGHNLVWHNQVPDWVFQNDDGTLTDRQTLLERMRQHISIEAGRYEGKIDGWDVVNEAVNSDGTLRQSRWMQIIGKEYLPLAYQYADSAAPNAELYYNDYDLYKPAKRQGVVDLVKYLQDQGVRVDGIGMQAHWGLEVPDLQQVQESIDAFAELGVKVMITELDITVLSDRADFGNTDSTNSNPDPYQNGLPDSVQTQLANRYRAIFNLLHQNRDKISRVTFWGVNNGDSWLNYIPEERTNYPLLFNRDNEPTPAFWDVVDMMSS